MHTLFISYTNLSYFEICIQTLFPFEQSCKLFSTSFMQCAQGVLFGFWVNLQRCRPLEGFCSFSFIPESSGWIAEAIKCWWWSFIRLHQIRCSPLCPLWKLCTLFFSGVDSDIINVHFSKWDFSDMLLLSQTEGLTSAWAAAVWTLGFY